MNFRDATAKYERWIGKRLTLIGSDLKLKHEEMRKEPFPFFRATYYRWAQLWPEVCQELKSAPVALAVGDLHVENFGTWRDIEGRLVWGVNDFDEVWTMAYTNDLVRLVASVEFAGIPLDNPSAAVLDGYSECLKTGGRPLVLAESNLDLRDMAVHRLKDPGAFWRKLDALATCKGDVPKLAKRGMIREMPQPDLEYRIVHRVAGLGSLGRQRFVALAKFNGGLVAREAKALAPSACSWAEGRKTVPGVLYQEMLDRAVRCRDPFVRMRDHWIVRRLAPDCSRIELADLPKVRDEERLLYYMGWETANVHLGTIRSKDILADLRKRKPKWLQQAAQAMVKAVKSDWKEWRKK